MKKFYTCLQDVHVKSLWKTIEEYIYQKHDFKIKFTNCFMIFGYNFQDHNSVPLNILILATKKYISQTTNNRLSLWLFNESYQKFMRKNI